jgi:UDP-glucuronate decarboxylase
VPPTSCGCDEGDSLLLVGGGGFLGHYLVQASGLERPRHGAPIRLTLLDNWARGVPAWLDSPPAPNLEWHGRTSRSRSRRPRTPRLGHPRRVDRLAVFYRKYPIETMDANVGGLRRLLDQRWPMSAPPDVP